MPLCGLSAATIALGVVNFTAFRGSSLRFISPLLSFPICVIVIFVKIPLQQVPAPVYYMSKKVHCEVEIIDKQEGYHGPEVPSSSSMMVILEVHGFHAKAHHHSLLFLHEA